MARTAVITGTATAVNRGMTRAASTRAQDKAYYSQQAQAPAYQPPPPPPQAASAGGDDVIAKLTQLGDLHASGVLSDEEFAAAKAKLLA
jgi:hypothetical protein